MKSFVPKGTARRWSVRSSQLQWNDWSAEERHVNSHQRVGQCSTSFVSRQLYTPHSARYLKWVRMLFIDLFLFCWLLEGDDRDSYVGVIPFFHSFGLTAQLLTALDSGGKVVTLPRFEAHTFLKSVNDTRVISVNWNYSFIVISFQFYKPTILCVAPPLASFLANVPALKTESLNRLTMIFSGGASMGTALATKLLERLGHHFSLLEGKSF